MRAGALFVCTCAAVFGGLIALGVVGEQQPYYGPPGLSELSAPPRLPIEAPPPSGTFRITRLLMPFDIAKVALADASQYDKKDAFFFRYLFLPYAWEIEKYLPTTNFVANLVLNRDALIQYGVQVHPQLVRYDLRLLASKGVDLQNLIDTFEELAFDPYWHEFIEVRDDVDDALDVAVDSFKLFLEALEQLQMKDKRATVKAEWSAFLQVARLQEELSRRRQFDLVFLNQVVKDADRVLVPHYFDTSPAFGNALKFLRDAIANLAKKAGDVAKVEVRSRRSDGGALGINQEITIPARHAGVAFALLCDLVQSDAAIVRADHFIHRATSTIDLSHGAGLYARFLGLRNNINDGNTDFSRLILDLGGNLEVINKQRTDQAAAMFTSNVTGRSRKILFFNVGQRVTAGTGLFVYTQDPSDEQANAQNDPIRNLIAFEFAAQEVIWERLDGMLGFSLYNAAGVFQASAPDNVVVDHSIPSPYTKRLQSCISCIRCHGPQGGHMAVVNDVQRLTKSGADVIDDLSSGAGRDELIARLVGQYEGDLTKPLNRSRDDFSEACFRSTKAILRPPVVSTAPPYYSLHELKGWTAAESCQHLTEVYNRYVYEWMGPKQILSELGYLVENERQALELLRQVIPPIGPDHAGFILLDPIIGAMRAGIPLPRRSVELVYFDIALRSMLTADKIKQSEVRQQYDKLMSRKHKSRPIPAGKLNLKKPEPKKALAP